MFKPTETPNWWQLHHANPSIVQQPSALALIQEIAQSQPFSSSIGKVISLPDAGTCTIVSAADIARQFLTSYLFAAGSGRWREAAFTKVWRDSNAYFDPTVYHIRHVLYAPVFNLRGIRSDLRLDSELILSRLPSSTVAQLASLSDKLAGVPTEWRRSRWSTLLMVRPFELEKLVTSRSTNQRNGLSFSHACWSLVGHELALLRSLLDPSICIPSFAVIRDSSLRDPAADARAHRLSWRCREGDPPAHSRRALQRFVRRRLRFMRLQSTRGWEPMLGSMRRFAIAWESPFPADTLRDIVAAMEGLLVGGDTAEVGYKLRVRAAHLLASSEETRRTVMRDIAKAYDYRSRVAHGGYVFDDLRDRQLASSLRVKGKGGNPFHDVNEVHRLRVALAGYYRDCVTAIIDSGELDVDWSARGL